MKRTVKKIQQRMHYQQFLLDKVMLKTAGLKKEVEDFKDIEGAK